MQEPSTTQDSLPDTCGVLLLPNAYLFPNNAAPLHIFEPRYQKMIADALENNWMFALGVLNAEESDNFQDCTHSIGTIGTIHNARELEDGRSYLILKGTHLVHFEEWLPVCESKPYPTARIRPVTRHELPSEDTTSVSSLVLDSVNSCLRNLPDNAQNDILTELKELSPTHLIDAVAQHFVPCDDARLALLAEPCAKKRASELLGYLHRK